MNPSPLHRRDANPARTPRDWEYDWDRSAHGRIDRDRWSQPGEHEKPDPQPDQRAHEPRATARAGSSRRKKARG